LSSIELPSLSEDKEGPGYSGLHCFTPSGINASKPTCPDYGGHVFALMTELGLYYGPLQSTNAEDNHNNHTPGAKLIPYELPVSLSDKKDIVKSGNPFSYEEDDGEGGSDNDKDDYNSDDNQQSLKEGWEGDKIDMNDLTCTPLSIVITNYHFLILAQLKFKKNEKNGRGIKGMGGQIVLLVMSRLDGSLIQCIELRNVKKQQNVYNTNKTNNIQYNKKQDTNVQKERTFGSKMIKETHINEKNKMNLNINDAYSKTNVKDNDGGDSGSHTYDVEGVPIRIFADIITGSIWLHTNKALYKVECIEEDRLIWHAYLEKALNRGLTPSERNGDNKDNENAQLMFSKALNYCKNDQDRSTVLQYQAEHFLLNGKPLVAAQYYARSDADFDVVILRLLNMISTSGIYVYI
jgi:hypothetical protein